MKNTDTERLIEQAYDQYMEGKGLMEMSTWMKLDDANISPARLWELFEEDCTPLDIYLNPTLLKENNRTNG